MAPVISNHGPSRPVSPARASAYLVVFVLIGMGLMAFGGYQAGHALGLLGEPGRLTVASCAEAGRVKPEIRCTGTFRPDGGRSLDPAAHIVVNPSLAAGESIRLDRVHTGSYVRISPARAEGYAALTLFGAALFAFGGAGFASRTNPSGRPEFRAGPTGSAGLRVGQAGVVLLLGAGLCLIIAFLSPLLGGD
ncbi:hypothetical protein [Streptomyces sp. NPDC052036]|uniref:hypothetical protein n=1 Tax=Streptomyces sp. NPDC052036 TaxID=3155171 RepID=UPI003417B0C5